MLIGCLAICYGSNAQDTLPVTAIIRKEKPLIRPGQLKLPEVRLISSQVPAAADSSAFRASFTPVPKKATLYSIVPGGGQIYNRDYWKLPLVYAAFGGAMYMIRWNTLRYHDYLTAYLTSYNLDTGQPSGKTEYEVYVRGKKTYYTLSLDNVKRGKDFYRRYRDWGYALIGASFALAAIEANVAAHLKTFDISDDLTFKIEPSFRQPLAPAPALGVRLVFNFSR